MEKYILKGRKNLSSRIGMTAALANDSGQLPNQWLVVFLRKDSYQNPSADDKV